MCIRSPAQESQGSWNLLCSECMQFFHLDISIRGLIVFCNYWIWNRGLNLSLGCFDWKESDRQLISARAIPIAVTRRKRTMQLKILEKWVVLIRKLYFSWVWYVCEGKDKRFKCSWSNWPSEGDTNHSCDCCCQRDKGVCRYSAKWNSWS